MGHPSSLCGEEKQLPEQLKGWFRARVKGQFRIGVQKELSAAPEKHGGVEALGTVPGADSEETFFCGDCGPEVMSGLGWEQPHTCFGRRQLKEK